MVSQLTKSLENLDGALNKLERAFDGKISSLNTRLDAEVQKSATASKTLDETITKIETLLNGQGS